MARVVKPKSVIRISLCRTTQRNPNDRFGLNKEEDMMKEAKPFVIDYVYAQNVECEEPCEGRLSRTVL